MKFSSTPRECGTAIFQMYWIMALNPPERHFGESIEFGGLRASRREMKRKRKAKEVVRLLTFARSNYRIGAGATFERTCSAIPPWTLGERIRPGRSNRRQSALWPPIIDAWLWAKRWWWSVNLSSHWKQEEVSIRLETYRRAQVTVEKVVTAQKMEAEVIKKKKKKITRLTAMDCFMFHRSHSCQTIDYKRPRRFINPQNGDHCSMTSDWWFHISPFKLGLQNQWFDLACFWLKKCQEVPLIELNESVEKYWYNMAIWLSNT